MQFEHGLIHVKMNAKIDKTLIFNFWVICYRIGAIYYTFTKNEKATINALQAN